MKWGILVWAASLVSGLAGDGFERVPLPELQHPALIKVLGDPASGQVFSPGRLWWPENDLLIQRHGDARLTFSIWDPASLRRREGIKASGATLSHDAKHVVMEIYNKEAKASELHMMRFPSGELLWSKEMDSSELAFAPGCSWFLNGQVDRLEEEHRFTILKMDIATGEVLGTHVFTEPRNTQSKRIYGSIESMAGSSRHVYVSVKEANYDFKLPPEERDKVQKERLRMFDAETWEKVEVPFDQRTQAPSSMQMSPDGKYVVLGGLHYSAVLTADLEKEVAGGGGAIAFSPNGKEVALPSRYSVTIQSLEDEAATRTLDFGASGAAYSPDGKQICFNDKGSLWCYDTATWEPAADEDPHRQCCPPREVAFDPTGNFLAVLDGRAVHLWDMQSLSQSHSLVSPRGRHTCFHGLGVTSNGKSVLASDGKEILKWNIEKASGEPVVVKGQAALPDWAVPAELSHRIEFQHDPAMKRLIIRWENEFRAFQNGELYNFQLPDVRAEYSIDWKLRPKSDELYYVGRLARQGKQAVSTLSTYDLVAGKPALPWKNAPNTTNFSPDGTQLVAIKDTTFHFYSVDGRKETKMIEVPQSKDDRFTLRGPVWSPNGRLVAALIDRHGEAWSYRIGLWDVKFKKLLGVVTQPTNISASSLAFTPAGDKLLSVHSDKSLLLWDAKKIVALGDKAP